MSYSLGGRGNPLNISKAEPMKTFAITNIQRRTVAGSFIGGHAEIQVQAADDGEALSEAVREAVGDVGTPSYTWAEIAPTVVETADLGLGWFANKNSDGSMTVRNCDAGQRIDLTPESVERLRQIFRDAGALRAA
jgi:hypothetical protein